MKNIYLIGWNNRMNNDVKSIIITPLRGSLISSCLCTSIKITPHRGFWDSFLFVYVYKNYIPSGL